MARTAETIAWSVSASGNAGKSGSDSSARTMDEIGDGTRGVTATGHMATMGHMVITTVGTIMAKCRRAIGTDSIEARRTPGRTGPPLRAIPSITGRATRLT